MSPTNNDEYYPVKVDGKWGFIDVLGNSYLDPQLNYDKVTTMIRGRFWAKRNSTWYFLDREGSVLDTKELSKFGKWYKSVIPVCRKFPSSKPNSKFTEKWGLYHRDSILRVDFIYDVMLDFHHGYAKVSRDKKWGYIDQQGTEVIPVEYESCFGPFNEVFVVKKKGWGLINKENEWIKPPTYPVMSICTTTFWFRFNNLYMLH